MSWPDIADFRMLDLPGVDTERILVNTDRIAKLNKLGGFANVAVGWRGQAFDDVRSAVTHKLLLPDDELGWWQRHDYTSRTTPDLEIAISKERLVTLVGQNADQSVNADIENEWALHLNDAMSQAYRSAGREALLKRPPFYMKSINHAGILAIPSIVASDSVLKAGGLYLLGKLISDLKDYSTSHTLPATYNVSQWRKSFFFGSYQPDRYIRLSLTTRKPDLFTARQ